MMNHDGPNYYDRGGGGYESADRNRDRMMRGASDRDTWHRAVDDFIDDRRRERDRSPARENRDYRDWKDRRRSDKEGRRGNYKSGGGSPRDDDRNSTGSGRYNRDNSNDSFRDYNNDDSNSRDWYQKKRGDRWNDDNDRKYRGGDYFREDERRNRDRERERSREYSRDSSRTSRGEETRNSSDRRRADDRSSNHSSEDGYDSSETRDSDYERVRSREFGDIDKMSYKDQVPNRTIIIRGLAQHITESDIREDTIKCKLVPKDIRLIRRKHTGTSRGFAFVEFLSTTEAISWMEMKQGELMLKDHYRAVMQYSLQRMENGREVRISDWHCTRCSAHNFKRRDFCYRCGCTRLEGELMEGVEEVCVHPTNTVLLRGLDALTTEENVLQSIQKLSTLPIRSVRIGRDPVMNTSRGVCYIEMNSVVEAVYLHNALLLNPVKVDNKVPVISYCRLHSTGGGGGGSGTTGPGSSSLASAAIAAAQWSHQKNKDEQEGTTSVITAQYTLEDVSKLADYSANLYAKSVAEKTKYFVYYHDYYTKAIQRGEQISLPSSATVAAQAQNDSAPHDESQNEKTTATVVSASATKTPLTEPPDGSGTQAYPTPDVSTYQYDKTSGYYYDPYTTLYYDANSQYFYNQRLQKFLYWDSVKSTYLPAPTVGAVSYAGAVQHPVQAEEEKDDEQKKVKEKEKQSEKDKVKVAKRIAKDMEKWAKTLNHKKEIARQNLITQQASMPAMKTQGAADIGFAVLERKDLAPRSGGSSLVQNEVSASSDNSLVAAYGQGSDSDDDNNDAQEDEKKLTDWNKLACLLCKRQFPSREVLIKHQQLSDLHKQNMESWYKARGLDPTDAQTRSQQYRDRAKERRQKYGEPDHPQPNRLKENYMKARQATISYEEPTKMGLGSDNLGNKLLQKMGWQEGMGLGKKNQGRTSIIETERRSATAGLGTKSVGVVPGPGETYKDCVKKMMKIRYQEIEENAT